MIKFLGKRTYFIPAKARWLIVSYIRLSAMVTVLVWNQDERNWFVKRNYQYVNTILSEFLRWRLVITSKTYLYKKWIGRCSLLKIKDVEPLLLRFWDNYSYFKNLSLFLLFIYNLFTIYTELGEQKTASGQVRRCQETLCEIKSSSWSSHADSRESFDSLHPSLTTIFLGRSSRLHPVSVQNSCT